ncbi:porin family protein [Prevotella sp.]|uniref:porin family protein n=1 Tax=uncultured Prevotella sp. TaxID=159272 RepID=UPI0027E2B3D9|nr:porin family protein [uncultured Prevotella sp.]
MKKTVLSLLVMLCCVAASAQPAAGKFSVIPRVGVSLANLSGDGVYYGSANATESWGSSRNKPGFTVGVDLDYQFTNSLSVMLGAHYAQQGCNYGNVNEKTSQSGNVNKYVGLNDLSTQLHVINVPLLFNYYVAPGFAVKTGVQLGFPVSGKLKYTETNFTENENDGFVADTPKKHDIDLNSTIKKVDFSIPVGLSFEYMNVIIDARYNIGLTNVQKDFLDLKPVKNRVFMFSAAYRFQL